MKKQTYLVGIVTILLLIFGSGYLTAAVEVQETALPKSTFSSQGAQAPQVSDRLYLDFKKTSLTNVLTVLSELSGMNFVIGKEVAEREVSMVLDNVTFQDALDAIARGSNVVYDYLSSQNTYLFRASADKAESPPLVARVFKLYYIHASELKEIEGSKGGGGSGSSGSTFTVLSEKQSTGENKSPISKIVESILSERGKVNVDDRSNSIVVTDTEDRIHLIEQAIAQLDRPLDQVLIRVILLETFEDLDRFLGVEWSNTTSEGTLGVVTGGISTTRFPFNVHPNGFDKNPFKELVGLDKTDLAGLAAPTTPAPVLGTKNFSNLTITLKALQSASKARILAKPRILVLDNHPALIKITTNEAVGTQTNTVSAANVGTNSTTSERTETGTSLRVTPLINTNGRITLTLEPSFVTAAAAASGAANTRDATIRAARTTLMVNDGQTIVLGGLLSSQQTRGSRKVPFLGDLPVLGEIFTRRTTQFDDRELMLFISPSIVRDPSEVQAIDIPDERGRMDDEAAPFWKVKRKNWFQKIKRELPPESIPEDIDIAARERLMDKTLVELAVPPVLEQTTAKPIPPAQEKKAAQTVPEVSKTAGTSKSSEVKSKN